MKGTKAMMAYHLPSFISVTIILTFFFYIINKEITRPLTKTLRIMLADTVQLESNLKFNPEYKGHFLPLRNYTDITFTGDNMNDIIKLKFAQIRIKEILSQTIL